MFLISIESKEWTTCFYDSKEPNDRGKKLRLYLDDFLPEKNFL